jgi:integrase
MIKSRDGIRGWFSEAEYQRLLAGIDSAISSGMAVRHVAVQRDLRFLSEIMVATMLRPSDVKLLQHRHIEIVQGKRLYLRITTSFSKTINSPVVSTAEGVAVYQRLRAYQAGFGFGNPDDFLFYPQYTNRKHASDILRRQFAAVLDSLSMRQSPQGEPRTLYSLRHSAIMFAILRGDTNLLKIARNARTSPDMIDRFYARHLTAEMGD